MEICNGEGEEEYDPEEQPNEHIYQAQSIENSKTLEELLRAVQQSIQSSIGVEQVEEQYQNGNEASSSDALGYSTDAEGYPYFGDGYKAYTMHLTKFEKAYILGSRATLIENGSSPFTTIQNPIYKDMGQLLDPLNIAKKELDEKVLPLELVRKCPNGHVEKRRVCELINRNIGQTSFAQFSKMYSETMK
jgi:DNA-directed RNA polymerase subunit K/omega